MKRTVRLLAGDTEWPWWRQTPKGDGFFGGTRFLIGTAECDKTHEDLIVVYEALPSTWTREVDPARCIFICGEPPSIKRYPQEFLAQFGHVISVDPSVRHDHLVNTQPALPWHVGINVGRVESYRTALSFSDLKEEPAKTRLCSVICSNKAMTSEHQKRLDFVEALMGRLGHKIDRYGRGFRPIGDKDEGLASYRYHVALENSSIENYWSEKLADPLLRNCFPIYWGATNVLEYFPSGSLIAIDIRRPMDAIDQIAATISSDTDMLAKKATVEAKNRVLTKYNLFAVLNDMLQSAEFSASGPRIRLRPESAFAPGLVSRVAARVRNAFRSSAV